MKKTSPAMIGGMNAAIVWPNMWLSGSRFRKRIGAKGPMYFRYFSIPSSMGLRLARMLPCVMMTPLGSPVAPEVKRISAVSPGAAGGNDSQPMRPRVEAVIGQTGHASPDGGLRSSPIRRAFALTIAAMRSTTFAEERKSTGTAITPSSRHPQSAITHSGRFSLQKRTRSPRAMPSARRRSRKGDRQIPGGFVAFTHRETCRVATPDFEESRERGRIADHLID